MDLDRIGLRDYRLQGLIAQARQWHRLDGEIKKILPANLRVYSRVACIDKEGCLIILAANNMALGRLKMIAPGLLDRMKAADPRIARVRIQASPEPEKQAKENRLKLGPAALAAFENSAERVEHHPELAEAMRKLVHKYK